MKLLMQHSSGLSSEQHKEPTIAKPFTLHSRKLVLFCVILLMSLAFLRIYCWHKPHLPKEKTVLPPLFLRQN